MNIFLIEKVMFSINRNLDGFKMHKVKKNLKFISMKNLKNLKGAKMLSKNEQQSIKGGTIICSSADDCPPNNLCLMGPEYGICVERKN